MKKFLFAFFIVCGGFSAFAPAQQQNRPIPLKTLVQIIKAEDELRFDKTLADLMKLTDAATRARAALAAGRIGDEAAIPPLTSLVENESEPEEVRATAVFAVGEIESLKGADALSKISKDAKTPAAIRARAVEALGKIAAANAADEKSKALGKTILEILESENARGAGQNREIILFGITAALRTRPEKTGETIAKFLTNADARVRADAANTLSRVRAKNANEQLRRMLAGEPDAEARANAARALGAAEDKDAFDSLLKAALDDWDARVRVSAIRSLGSLKNKAAAEKLIERGGKLLADFKKSKSASPSEKSELLEIATVLGRILPDSSDEKALAFLIELRAADKFHSPETEIAFARVAPEKYLTEFDRKVGSLPRDWRAVSSFAQGLGEIAAQKDENLKKLGIVLTAAFFDDLRGKTPPAEQAEMSKAAPDMLRALGAYQRAFAAYDPKIISGIILGSLATKEVNIRATAAELLAEMPVSKEATDALKKAFIGAMLTDTHENDAQLAILDALYKLDKKEAVSSLLLAAKAPDHLVRRKALQLLKTGDFTEEYPGIPTIVAGAKTTLEPNVSYTETKLGQIVNSSADYTRAAARRNGSVKAILTTGKGAFTIELAPEDAPLAVDNFIKLARSGYFNGLAVHRVVPNFVMQDGDPRGDGSGGPGWQIRCEVNMLGYTRGAVGMALSGKDTGGSQWFVTHSAQPHLDGGYTVFGRVNETGMKIVDEIVRGDVITSVKIVGK